MAPVSLSPTERARKNVQVILQALAATGQVEAARAMAVHESTVSRMKADHMDNFGALLAALALKVVPAGVQCFDPAYVESLRELARHGIEHGPRPLDWSDTQ
jgi:DNA-binding sugar fermentation-stimulating protein